MALLQLIPDTTPVKGVPTPYPSPRIGAALVERGIDEFYHEECYVWCHLIETDGDWELEQIGESAEQPPFWWDDPIQETGLQYHLTGEHSMSGFAGHGEVLDWALREGLVLGQEFLVYVSRPDWYKCGWEYPEYDYDCDCFVIRKCPTTLSIRDLERSVAETFTYWRDQERLKEDFDKARWAATSRMFLQWRRGGFWPNDVWCSVGLVSSLADPDRPEVHMHCPLAWGYSDHNDREEALSVLRDKIKEKRPDLDLSQLPTKRPF